MNCNLLKTIVFVSLIIVVSIVRAAAYQQGDLTPRGAPDGVLDVSDLLILQRLISGELIPTIDELIIGDVAPLNSSDGSLDVADVLILQRAILGQVTLGPVNIPPQSPVLDPVTSPTSDNPYPISGMAQPGTTVSIYVNNAEKGSVQADATTGVFSILIVLDEGGNEIYAVADDGVDISAPSASVTVEFQYIDGGILSGVLAGQTLNANTRYTVTSDISITTGNTLIVEAGAKIIFAAGAGLNISGVNTVLDIRGTAQMPVVFTSMSPTPAAGDWKGIEIGNDALALIDNAIIEYAADGLFFNITYYTTPDSTVTNSVIRFNGNGINAYQLASPSILHNRIYNNGNGIFVHHSTTAYGQGSAYVKLNNNEIYNNGFNYYTENTRNYAQVPMMLDATNNWWGTAVPEEISASIHDYRDVQGDAYAKGRTAAVDISGFLDAPGGVSVGQVLPPVLNGVNAYNSGSVYLVGDSKVPADSVLNIGAGVTVIATGNYALQAGSYAETNPATINITGSASNPVIFTSDKLNPSAGDWKGIEIATNAVSNIDYVVIKYAENGIYYNETDIGSTLGIGGSLSNCIINNNVNGINVYRYATPNIQNCQIYDNSIGLYVHHDRTQYYGYGLAYPVINNSEIYDNTSWNYYTKDMRESGRVQPMLLGATGNWWGTADPVKIAASIYDYGDPDMVGVVNSDRPIIDFGHALDAPDGAPINLYVNETLNVNTTFDSETYIFSELRVAPGSVLNITSSARLKFANGAALVIDGGLTVAGDANNTVVFGPIEPTTDRSYWNGILINTSALNVSVDGCYISNAKRAFEFLGSNGSISNCVITENDVGVYISGASDVSIISNLIVNNNYGIYLYYYGIVNLQVLQNDIYNNAIKNVYLDFITDTSAFNFAGNWWNSTDLSVIHSSNRYYRWTEITLDSIATISNYGAAVASLNIDFYNISPVSSPGVQDQTTLSASLTSADSWLVEVVDSTNAVVFSQGGTGTAVTAVWDGRNASGVVQGDGVYLLRIKSNGQIVFATSIVVDNTMPVSVIDNLLEGLIATGNSLFVAGTAIDANLLTYSIEIADGSSPAPEDYRGISSSQLGVNSGSLMDWLFNDAADNQEQAGEKTIRLSVTDKAGNVSVDTVLIMLDYLSISNVSYSPQSFTPFNGEQLTVNFTLGKPAMVYLRIYDEKKYKQGVDTYGTGFPTVILGDTLYRTISANYNSAGSYSLLWDGKDENGQLVPNDVYRFEIDVDDGQTVNNYFVPVPAEGLLDDTLGSMSYTKKINAYDWSNNDNVKLNVVVNPGRIARVYLGASYSGGSSAGAVLAINQILEEGSYVSSWDGRSHDHKLFFGSTRITNLTFLSGLAPNSVYVKNKLPAFKGVYTSPNIEIKSNPALVKHSYDQISNTQYTIDEKSYVTVKLLPPCSTIDTNGCTAEPDQPAAITLVDNELLDADDGAGGLNIHSFSWHGYDHKTMAPDTNNILVTAEGYYTYFIEATSFVTGNKASYRGTLRLLH